MLGNDASTRIAVGTKAKVACSAVDLVSSDDNSDGKGSDDDSQVDKSEKKFSKPGKGKITSAPRGEPKKVIKDMSRKGSTTVAAALAGLSDSFGSYLKAQIPPSSSPSSSSSLAPSFATSIVQQQQQSNVIKQGEVISQIKSCLVSKKALVGFNFDKMKQIQSWFETQAVSDLDAFLLFIQTSDVDDIQREFTLQLPVCSKTNISTGVATNNEISL